MEERRRIDRVGYQAKSVIVVCDSGESIFVETCNVSPLGIAFTMPAGSPDLKGKDIIIVAAKKWTAQWFETNVMGEKKKRRKRGFETKREALEFERRKKLSNERSMDMKLSDFIETRREYQAFPAR